MHMRKVLTVLLALLLAAGIMPLQVRAEETGEEAETFESYEYEETVEHPVTCYANGGKFDTSLEGVSSDGKKRVWHYFVDVYEDYEANYEEYQYLEIVDTSELAEQEKLQIRRLVYR